MTTPHLSDDELQQAADKAALPPDPARHLASCPVCLSRVKAYQRLFTALALQSRPALEFNAAALVLAQLPPQRRASFPWALSIIAALVLGLVTGTLWVLWTDMGLFFSELPRELSAGLLGVASGWVGVQTLWMLWRYRQQTSYLQLS